MASAITTLEQRLPVATRAFVAHWSFSETPVSARRRMLPSFVNFDAWVVMFSPSNGVVLSGWSSRGTPASLMRWLTRVEPQPTRGAPANISRTRTPEVDNQLYFAVEFRNAIEGRDGRMGHDRWAPVTWVDGHMPVGSPAALGCRYLVGSRSKVGASFPFASHGVPAHILKLKCRPEQPGLSDAQDAAATDEFLSQVRLPSIHRPRHGC